MILDKDFMIETATQPSTSPPVPPSPILENGERTLQEKKHPKHSLLAIVGLAILLLVGTAVLVFFRLTQQESSSHTVTSAIFGNAENNNSVEGTAVFSSEGEMSDQTISDDSSTLQDPTQLETSSTPENIKLLFVGDMMFDRNIRIKMQRHELGTYFPLKQLEPYFQQFDYVIGNLEGPVSDNPSRSVGSTPGSTNNFFFTFQPEIAQTLYDQNLRIVNLGNNHILNFGTDGVEQTKTYLDKANVRHFGDTSLEATSDDRTIIVDHHGFKLGFVGYNQFIKDGLQHALDDIEWLKPQVNLVIVYPHWGNEYVPTANAAIVNMAHQLVDQGADLIIGAHPHVIQNVEEYNHVKIYYSLGNFVFDQYFSQEVQEGMMVEVTIDPTTNALQFSEKKVQLRPDGSTIMKDSL